MNEMDHCDWTDKAVKEAGKLRLLATSPDDFANRIQAWVAKHHGVEMTVAFACLTFHPLCSCTHAAPVGGVTNFSCHKHLPSGYAGLYGRLHLSKTIKAGKYCGELIGSFNNRITGLNTGTGGGGHTSQYEVTLFCDDFPKFGYKYIGEYMLDNI